MRTLFATLLLLAGCDSLRPCAPGTVLVSLSFVDGAQAADSVDVTVAVGGGAPRTRSVAHAANAGSGSVALAFSDGYPANAKLTLTLQARQGGLLLATTMLSATASGACLSLAATLDGRGSGGGGTTADLGGGDLAQSDLSDSPAGDLACTPTVTSCPATAPCGSSVDDGCGGQVSCGRCQLTSLQPPLATAGSTLTLEGTFAATATVTFAGGATAPATVAGPHRATVVVPAGARSGGLTVASGGSQLGPLPFRVSAFTPGLSAFRSAYDQTTAPQALPAPTVGRYLGSTAVVGDSVYVFGGWDRYQNPLASVERATIGADGTLSAFQLLPNVTLASPRYQLCSLVIGNWIYVFGGRTASGADTTVERAAIGADGTLSSFAVIPGVTLALTHWGASAAIVGNSVYVLSGGDGMGGLEGTVERATIGADGSLSTFAIVPNVALATARVNHGSAVIGNWLYVFGGSINGVLDSVERAAIAADGTLSAFVAVPDVKLATPLSEFATLVTSEGLYLLGGFPPGQRGSVERAAIGSDGSLAPFAEVGSLTDARYGLDMVVAGDFVYLFGGFDSSGIAPTERASLYGQAAPHDFVVAPGALPGAQSHAALAVAGNSVYLIGGHGAGGQDVDSVQRAQLGADGQLGAFALVPGVTLKTARSGHAALVSGNQLYVLGGDSGGPIEQSTVAADGSLSPFTVATATLSTARVELSTAVVGPWLYAMGGYAPTGGTLSTIERAAIAADGTIGSFSPVAGTLATPRRGATVVVSGSTIYLVGGFNGAPLGTVEQTTVASDGTIPTFTVNGAVNLIDARGEAASVVVGDSLYVLGGVDTLYNGVAATVEKATFGAGGALSTFATVSGLTLATPRTSASGALLGGSLFVFGGITGTGGSLPSIERADLY